ncbi:hypothetical protein [Plesiomonas shigelloides]|uniref:hypothetical protein n=1 Tax=Plesiomonas shigelloides TaxID=703 RepID=UPI003EBED26E
MTTPTLIAHQSKISSLKVHMDHQKAPQKPPISYKRERTLGGYINRPSKSDLLVAFEYYIELFELLS